MITFIKIIFLLGFLILIHELGHFIVAKKCKIKVNNFSIGFGPCIFKKKYKDTTYELRIIPLGGYVNLEGEEKESIEKDSFNKASIGKKLAIILAGALVNIIFGLLLFAVIILIRYNIETSNGIIESIKFAFTASIDLIKKVILGIGQLFTGRFSLNDMTGPIGISQMVSQTNGIIEFLYLLSIISISLGVTNLLPIVPLDGGKILFLIIEAIRKKPIDKEIELKIQSIGLLFLITLSILVTANDISKFF